MVNKSPKAAKQVKSGFVSFEYRDVTFSMPVGEDIPLKAIKAFQNDRIIDFVELSLGAEQWSKLEGTGDMNLRDFKEMMSAFNDASTSGTSLGE